MKHECKYWKTLTHRRPWLRYCSYCGRREWNFDGKWEQEMSLRAFATKWIPAISGTKPTELMRIDVAMPFEWNSYENWDVVFRVTFCFGLVTERVKHGMGTKTDIMNGWQSKYAEHFNQIDREAEVYFKSRYGKPYEIGDNCYTEMREAIQG